MSVCEALALVGVCAFALPLAAAAGPPPPRSISWADLKHGWAPCSFDESELCSTENGGKTWRRIFSGGNYLFAYARTSATSGVVESGNSAARTFWTRTNGRRWYELPNVPKPDFSRGEDEISFAGRGSLFFWGTGQSLNQLTGWPARADPPCRGFVDDVAPPSCTLNLVDSPFGSREVATSDNRHAFSFGQWNLVIVDGGLAALTMSDGGSPESVFLYRHGVTSVEPLPDPPSDRASLTWLSFAVDWPRLFVEAVRHASPAPTYRADVLWRSSDGGASWHAQSTTSVRLRGSSTSPGRVGRHIAVPGGWIAPGRGAPTRLVVHIGRLHGVRLPSSRGCRPLASLVVAWPELYATAGHASWWSADGGVTWALAGRC